MRTTLKAAVLSLSSILLASPALADGPSAQSSPPGGAPTAPAGVNDGGRNQEDRKRWGFGIDGLFTVPVGELSDETGPLIGASLRGGYFVTPQLEGFVRLGFQSGGTKDLGTVPVLGRLKKGINNNPLLLGARYFLLAPKEGLYAELEVGANRLATKGEIQGLEIEAKRDTRLGANIGVGYIVSKDLPINIGAQLSLLNLVGKESGEKAYMGINVLAGYEFRF